MGYLLIIDPDGLSSLRAIDAPDEPIQLEMWPCDHEPRSRMSFSMNEAFIASSGQLTQKFAQLGCRFELRDRKQLAEKSFREQVKGTLKRLLAAGH